MNNNNNNNNNSHSKGPVANPTEMHTQKTVCQYQDRLTMRSVRL